MFCYIFRRNSKCYTSLKWHTTRCILTQQNCTSQQQIPYLRWSTPCSMFSVRTPTVSLWLVRYSRFYLLVKPFIIDQRPDWHRLIADNNLLILGILLWLTDIAGAGFAMKIQYLKCRYFLHRTIETFSRLFLRQDSRLFSYPSVRCCSNENGNFYQQTVHVMYPKNAWKRSLQ